MKQKMELAMYNMINKIQKTMRSEDGMETLETVILVAVAVIVAGAIIVVVAGAGHDGNGGVIGNLFDNFTGAITNLFGGGEGHGTT